MSVRHFCQHCFQEHTPCCVECPCRRLPCGCDVMVVEDAESCKRCDDDDCEETDGCERFRAFKAHTLHTVSTLAMRSHAPDGGENGT